MSTSDSREYVHGYSEREAVRLADQANTLADLLHHDSLFPPGSRILESGCGVGAQTVTLARINPDSTFVSMDISEASLAEARNKVERLGYTNVTFQHGDIFDLPFPDASFDYVFVCFVLEHLKEPVEALRRLARVIKPGGGITVIEGDHGSTFFHPDSPWAHKAIQCQVDLQAEMGGNSLIGRSVYPLLVEAGFDDVAVSPRMVYVDASRPQLVEGFTKNTFTAMVEGVGKAALARGLVTEEEWARGIRDLYRTTAPDGVFCYTFFKGVARKGEGLSS